MFGALVVGLGSAAWIWRPPPFLPAGVQHFLPVASPGSDSAIEAAVQRFGWTEYRDYGTVRIGRIERQAQLVTGRTQWLRQVIVPSSGARYEAYVGAMDAAVTVRVGRPGDVPLQVRAEAGMWTRVAVHLDSVVTGLQTIGIDIEVPPGGVAAWGSEVLIPVRQRHSSPDVVLISLDTVRRDRLTPYTPSVRTTPALAALASEAIVFDQAIATSSWTMPSHAALFTGRVPADSLGFSTRVEPEEQTLPELFAARGYRTFGVSGGPYTDPRFGFQQGFEEYVASGDRENARDVTSRAIEWRARTAGAHAFLFLNYFDAHEPLELSRHVQAATGVTEGVPLSMWHELDSGRLPVSPEVRHRLLRAYGAELSAIDFELRRLFDYLRRSGRWKRTLLIVWGDHGQLLGEHGYVGHALTLDEELIRVPLIIKPPAGTRLAPSNYRGVIQNEDVFALAQSLAGLPSEQGAHIVSALETKTRIRRWSFSKIHHDPSPELLALRRWRSATQWAIRDGVTKIVRDLEGRSFAYDITGEEERPIPLPGPDSSLAAALDRFRVWTQRESAIRSVGPLSPAEVERLRSLGYVH